MLDKLTEKFANFDMSFLYKGFAAAKPILMGMDPEKAHTLVLKACANGLIPKAPHADDKVLAIAIWGIRFRNPLGLAAGFDKNADAVEGLLNLGFGFIEVGTVTPEPEAGNKPPRIFRLAKDEALINRMGFPNVGLREFKENLAASRGGSRIIGTNIATQKGSETQAKDYETLARSVAPFSDYVVINVSSPNTPGLRALQARSALQEIVNRARAGLMAGAPQRTPPLLVKVAPDLTDEDVTDIAAVAMGDGIETGPINGLVVGNTTVSRPSGLASAEKLTGEVGGLSGRPLFEPSTELLRRFYSLTDGRMPLVGVGGVFSGADAYRKIRAGASLVQLYTALIYRGPAVATDIKRELANLLTRDGFRKVHDAIGADHRDGPSPALAAHGNASGSPAADVPIAPAEPGTRQPDGTGEGT